MIIDQETKGVILGMVASITSSLVTLYIAQHYIIQKAATAAANAAVQRYKQQTEMVSTAPNWTPLSDYEISQVRNFIINS